MPTVTVLQGPRDVEMKRALITGITDAFVDALGIPADSVQVWIQETPADSWGQLEPPVILPQSALGGCLLVFSGTFW